MLFSSDAPYYSEPDEPAAPQPTDPPQQPDRLRELEPGDNNNHVKAMQTRLVELGWLDSGNDTGYFGDITKEALNGFLYRPINPLFRLALVAGGLGMMIPGTLTDVIGLAVVVGIVLYQRAMAKKVEKA